MSKCVMAVLCMAFASTGLYATDGQVLINTSTVMAAGGYPYVISQPGSYKLSGNLTASVNAFAIQIAANNVTLDLNGFTVQCSVQLGHSIACIGTPLAGPGFHDLVVRNGMVVANLVPGGAGALYFLGAVYFGFPSLRIKLEELHLTSNDDASNLGVALSAGANSTVKGVIGEATSGQVFSILCPSLIVQNVNTGIASDAGLLGCVVTSNYRIN